MSIASIVDARLARDRHPSRPAVSVAPRSADVGGAGNTITPLPAANDVSRWIPSEAIALYLAFYTGIFGTSVTRATDFSTRWQFFFIAGIGGTTLLVILIYAGKRQLAPDIGSHKLPLPDVLLADLAFAAWALALPTSPAVQWSDYGDWFPIAALLGGTTLVPLIAGAFGMTPPSYVVADAAPAVDVTAQETGGENVTTPPPIRGDGTAAPD